MKVLENVDSDRNGLLLSSELWRKFTIIIQYDGTVMLRLLHDPFQGVETWRETMEAQKLDYYLRPEPEITERNGVADERVVQRLLSWAV